MNLTLVKLTPVEREILSHRLGVPDALAECLEETFPKEKTAQTADELRHCLENAGDVLFGHDVCKDAILADCCNGSTFFANAEDAAARGEISRGELL